MTTRIRNAEKAAAIRAKKGEAMKRPTAAGVPFAQWYGPIRAEDTLSIAPDQAVRDVVEMYGITQAHLAEAMKMSRLSVNQICSGRRGITADVAVRLAHVTGTTPFLWLGLQLEKDVRAAQKRQRALLPQLQILRKPGKAKP